MYDYKRFISSKLFSLIMKIQVWSEKQQCIQNIDINLHVLTYYEADLKRKVYRTVFIQRCMIICRIV